VEGTFVDTSREAFRIAHDVSAYSLVALARGAAPLMTDGGSILAMSYYGAVKVVPHYNVMASRKLRSKPPSGIWRTILAKEDSGERHQCWPVNTLAARGIAGFTSCSSTTRNTPR